MHQRTIAPRSLGSLQLAAIISNNGKVRRAVATDCECTEQAVRTWAAGTSVPQYRSRKLLWEKRGIEIDSWDVAATSSQRAA